MALGLKKFVRPVLLVLVLFAVFSALRANVPAEAFRRSIVVNVPQEVAWDHFANVPAWKSWLSGMESVEITPSDTVAPDTVATLVMGGMSTTFRMAEFDRPNHWMWTSDALWFTMLYDHIFERVSDTQTRIVLHMRVTGFGKTIFARLVAWGSQAGHAEALPLLQQEMNGLPAAAPAARP